MELNSTMKVDVFLNSNEEFNSFNKILVSEFLLNGANRNNPTLLFLLLVISRASITVISEFLY